MQLATFAVDTQLGPKRRVGINTESGLVDATTGYACVLDERGEPTPVELAESIAPPEMIAFLERGERAIEAARDVVSFVERDGRERGPNDACIVFDSDDVQLLSPLPRPNSLRDCMAFEEHVANTMGEDVPEVWYEQPIYYKGNPDSIRGTGETVVWPDSSELMDFELELAAVIGREGRDIPVEAADSYIAGYTIFNDFSARDVQGREMEGNLGPAKGKDFANALGPYLVTADSFDVESATMTAEIDGETWSSGTPGAMEHTFAEIVAHVSRDEPLHPGDVIGSGTVGEGCGLEIGRFLDDGDRIALSVEGIGTLENRVVTSE
ncbi:fumarylacetoacetate hydrolase family protein [Halococcus qingdaonensis]|uniref:fumarylacetoacetate hydrolase family protein n=1 Tax=Halococcus qingdaonensis TaxID=224402 RepID=UPI0021171E99|nr:fumarylacetoacetate hydrolase family protein [Halococcus qingdaonensis]